MHDLMQSGKELADRFGQLESEQSEANYALREYVVDLDHQLNLLDRGSEDCTLTVDALPEVIGVSEAIWRALSGVDTWVEQIALGYIIDRMKARRLAMS
jgi:hypothetical protein